MATRAFMSDVDGGPYFLDDRGVLTDADRAMAAKWAANELRMVLAVTEPAGCEYGGLGPCRYGCRGYDSCPDATFRMVLAESLAAFTEGS